MRHDGRIRPGGAEGRTLVWFSFWPGPFYKGRVEGTLQASTRIERGGWGAIRDRISPPV